MGTRAPQRARARALLCAVALTGLACESRDIELDDGYSGECTGLGCGDGVIDCSDVDPSELVLICGVTEKLCEQCGPCLLCDDREAVCDFRPSGDDTVLLACAGDPTGCFERVSCDGDELCIDGAFASACESEVSCAEVGCTGFALCEEDPPVCGPCGCCVPHERAFCGFDPLGAGEAVWLRERGEDCYDVIPCGPTETCVWSGYGVPTCVVL